MLDYRLCGLMFPLPTAGPGAALVSVAPALGQTLPEKQPALWRKCFMKQEKGQK